MSDKTRSVFIIDDDPMMVQMLKDHLSEKLPLNITTFSTGEDCLRNLDKNPEVVILDYYLNSVEKEAANGIEILKKIKAASPDTEVIMLSGQEKIEIAVDTMAHGAYDYIIKNESSFVRAENKVKNVFKSKRLEENLATYKKAALVLGVILALIIIASIILIVTGIGTDSPSVAI